MEILSVQLKCNLSFRFCRICSKTTERKAVVDETCRRLDFKTKDKNYERDEQVLVSGMFFF